MLLSFPLYPALPKLQQQQRNGVQTDVSQAPLPVELPAAAKAHYAAAVSPLPASVRYGRECRLSVNTRYHASIDSESLVALVLEYSALIPPAAVLLSGEELADSGKSKKGHSFNRRQRIRVLYYLMALEEQRCAAPNASAILTGGEVQLFRLRNLLNAIENNATDKIERFEPEEDPGHHWAEDPTVMRVQLGDRQSLRLQDGVLFDVDRSLKSQQVYFPANDSILVIPSTCEYTLLDKYGRLMVMRVRESMQVEPLYPYSHTSAEDVNAALRHGEVVFNLPQAGTDILGRPLHSTFIAGDWQVSDVQQNELPGHYAKAMRALRAGLDSFPYESSSLFIMR